MAKVDPGMPAVTKLVELLLGIVLATQHDLAAQVRAERGAGFCLVCWSQSSALRAAAGGCAGNAARDLAPPARAHGGATWAARR